MPLQKKHQQKKKISKSIKKKLKTFFKITIIFKKIIREAVDAFIRADNCTDVLYIFPEGGEGGDIIEIFY